MPYCFAKRTGDRLTRRGGAGVSRNTVISFFATVMVRFDTGDHNAQSDTIVAPSVKAFAQLIVEDPTAD